MCPSSFLLPTAEQEIWRDGSQFDNNSLEKRFAFLDGQLPVLGNLLQTLEGILFDSRQLLDQPNDFFVGDSSSQTRWSAPDYPPHFQLGAAEQRSLLRGKHAR